MYVIIMISYNAMLRLQLRATWKTKQIGFKKEIGDKKIYDRLRVATNRLRAFCEYNAWLRLQLRREAGGRRAGGVQRRLQLLGRGTITRI